MRCTKTKYNKRKAQEVLNNLIKSGKWNHKENEGRIYECKSCKSWHITHLEPYINDESIGDIKFKKKWKKLLKK
jgi:hypothetical protein